MQVVDVSIADLIPANYNPRKLSADQEQSLKQSLSKFGFVDPVIVNSNPARKNIVIGGHQRLKVWQMLGHQTAPVFYIDLDQDQERELNIRLNKNTGEFDWSLLQEFFKKDELMSWGFTESDLYGRFKSKTTGDDDVPGVPSVPKSRIGDRYQLGNHVVMCGDSTSAPDMQKLMGGSMADLCFTDPPYNVNYKGAGKNTTRTIENDNMGEMAFRSFLQGAFQRIHEATSPNAALYCCYAARTHREFEDSINAAGFFVRNQIIWVKTIAAMGWGDYRWKHEPMLYCLKEGAKRAFYADRTQTTAWDEAPSDQEILEAAKKLIKHEEDGNSTVWRFSRETDYFHPTQKPMALVTKAIINSSKTNDIILDAFGGSGSTLIAAEKNQRQARLMEFDPTFVDVIVQRYVEFCKKNEREWNVIKNGTDITDSFNPD